MAFGSVRPAPEPRKLFNISGLDSSSNQQAVPVPYFAGDAKLPLTWICPPYNIRAKKIKSDSGGKAQSKGDTAPARKKYSGDICGIACYCPDDAPVDAVLFVLVNDEVAFKGPLNRTPGQHYAAFSMQKYCQDCRVWWGTKDSPFDDHVLGMRGAIPSDPGFNPRNKATWAIDTSSGGTVINAELVAGVPDPKSGHYDQHPPYRNQCRFGFRQFHLGSSKNMPNVVVIVRRGTGFFAGSIAAATEGVNPMGPAYELFTDDLAGAGLPAARLDQTSWQGAKTTNDNSAVKMAPSVTEGSDLRSFFADYLAYYNGWLRSKNNTLEAGVFLTGANINRAALLTLDDDDLVEEPEIPPGSDNDTSNYFSLTITNRSHWYNSDDNAARYIDQDNFLRVGERRFEQVRRPWFIDEGVGARYVTQYGMIKAQPSQTGSITVKRERVKTLRPGDLFQLNSASYLQTLILRVLSRELSEDRAGAVKLSVQREPGTWPTLYDPNAIPKLGDFLFGPAPLKYVTVVELPFDLRGPGIALAVFALRPNEITIGFNLLFSDDNVDYDPIASQHQFICIGKLAQAYAASTGNPDTATGMVVDLYGYDLDNIVGQSNRARDNDTLLIWVESVGGGYEIMSAGEIDVISSGRCKVFSRRARYQTLQADHAVGANAFFVFRSEILAIGNSAFYPGNTVYFKFATFTEIDDYDPSADAPYQLTLKSPFAVAQLGLSPSSQSFSAVPLNVYLTAIYGRADLEVHYTIDGIGDPTRDSPEWPTYSNIYVDPLQIRQSCTVAVRGWYPDGTPTPVVRATYTLVASGSSGLPTCGIVVFGIVSGAKGRTTVVLSMSCATGGNAIHYSVNGGSLTTYTGQINVPLNSSVVAYASASGYADSPPSVFNNRYTGGNTGTAGGGGSSGGTARLPQ